MGRKAKVRRHCSICREKFIEGPTIISCRACPVDHRLCKKCTEAMKDAMGDWTWTELRVIMKDSGMTNGCLVGFVRKQMQDNIKELKQEFMKAMSEDNDVSKKDPKEIM